RAPRARDGLPVRFPLGPAGPGRVEWVVPWSPERSSGSPSVTRRIPRRTHRPPGTGLPRQRGPARPPVGQQGPAGGRARPADDRRGRATTAGAVVVGGLTQQRDQVNPATYIGKGKLEELQEQAQAADADVIIFDNDLSPGQVRNLEKATSLKVLDRSELILDI